MLIGACHCATPIEADTPDSSSCRRAAPAGAPGPAWPQPCRAAPDRRSAGSRRTHLRRSVQPGRKRGTRPSAPGRPSAACVAGLMAVPVVDQLEVVEVDQQARERTAGPRGTDDLLVQAAAHRAVVHAAGDRIGARLGARAHERERRGGLVDQRRLQARCERSSKATETRRRRASRPPPPHPARRAAPAARSRPAGCASRGTLAASSRSRRRGSSGRARDPAHPRRPLGAGEQVAQPPIGVEQVDGHQVLPCAAAAPRWCTWTSSAPGPESSCASARKIASSRALVGEHRQPPHAGQQRVDASGLA